MNEYILPGITQSEFINDNKRFKWYDRNLRNLERDAMICEDFIGLRMDMIDIAKKHEISYPVVQRIITRYFEKPQESIRLLSEV